MVASVPSIDPEQFESMVTGGMEVRLKVSDTFESISLTASVLQDLLMIVYLANITQAQLSLGEKLTSIL